MVNNASLKKNTAFNIFKNSINAKNKSLEQKSTSGVIWSVIGLFSDNAFRFLSSLILTRILFPEAFGIIATTGVLFMALELLSDIGIAQAIIQNKKGDEETYLNTAWTLQIIRGIILTLISMIASLPLSIFYREPILFPVIIISSFGVLLRGFNSPSLFLLKRWLEVRRLALMEIFCSLSRISFTILLAFIYKNVWALVIGGLLGHLILLVLSYIVLPYRPSFKLNKIASSEIIKFGRFILISGVLGFLTMRLDTMLIPRFLGMEIAGVYTIAVTISMMLTMLLNNIVDRVVYPLFCGLNQDFDRLKMRQDEILDIYCSILIPVVLLISANSRLLINFLYDPRYSEAGTVLGFLLIGGLIQGGCRLINSAVMAMGKSHVGTISALGFFLLFCILLPVLSSYFNIKGYAAAKMLGSIGGLVPLLWFSFRLNIFTFKKLIVYLQIPLVMIIFLSAIKFLGIGIFYEVPYWIILELVIGLLFLSSIFFFWKRILIINMLSIFKFSK